MSIKELTEPAKTDGYSWEPPRQKHPAAREMAARNLAKTSAGLMLHLI